MPQPLNCCCIISSQVNKHDATLLDAGQMVSEVSDKLHEVASDDVSEDGMDAAITGGELYLPATIHPSKVFCKIGSVSFNLILPDR